MAVADALRVFLSRRWAGLAMASLVLAPGVLVVGVNRVAGSALIVLGVVMFVGAAASLIRNMKDPQAYGDIHVIDGTPVHILAEGEPRGNHPVIWVAGGHGEGLIMHHLHAAIRDETRSILFDRTGSGWTGAARGPVTISDEVGQLKKLLDMAGEQGPFVLVGHSFGGLFSANFAHHYPQNIAGLVLLDSTPPWNVAFAGRLSFSAVIRRAWWGALKSHFGLERWVEPEIDDPESDMARELRDVSAVINRHSVQAKSLLAEASVFESCMKNPLDLVIGKGDLGDTPLLLLSANPPPEEQEALRSEISMELGLSELQADNLLHGLRDSVAQQVALSSRGRHKPMPVGASHMFPYEFPDQVLAEVRAMMAGQAR